MIFLADRIYTHENAEEWDGYTYSKPGFSSEKEYEEMKAKCEKVLKMAKAKRQEKQ